MLKDLKETSVAPVLGARSREAQDEVAGVELAGPSTTE